MCPLKQAALYFPHLQALRSEMIEWTFQKWDLEVEKIAETLPFNPGDLISYPCPITIDALSFFFAVLRKKASIFPLNPTFPQGYVDHPPKIPFQEPAVVVLTSGSTSTPKKALISLKSLIENAKRVIPALNLQPQDHWKLSLPLHHVSGIGILLRSVIAGACLVLDEDPSKITHISMVPTQLYRNQISYPNLKALLLGGAPLPSSIASLPIYRTYGLTEMGSAVTINEVTLPDQKIKLAPDGEILVKGPSCFEGYLNEDGIDRPFDTQGWFHTKDLGEITLQGLEIIGRKDFQFISGGENIQPEEIEKELRLFPSIEEAVVVAQEDAEFGQIPIAFIQSNSPSIEEKEIQLFLLNRLPKFKIPKKIIKLSQIPRIGFKINRKELQNNLK